MKGLVISLLFAGVLFAMPGLASGLSFRQVAYIPVGMVFSSGYMKALDINHDGVQDFMFSGALPNPLRRMIVFYGCRPYNRYTLEDTIRGGSLPWDVAHIDGDSLLDMVVQVSGFPCSIVMYEASDYWSFPTNLVWSWRFEWIGNSVQPMYFTDLDQDGIKEILFADCQVVYVFENRGDNQYVKVFCDTIRNVPTGSFAFGDFDGDSRMEFVCGTYGGQPTSYGYECIGDDQYQKTWDDTLITGNLKDCIACPDLDNDGKLEFLLGGCRTGPAPWSAHLWIYEATGNNQYEVIFADSIPLSDQRSFSLHSDCGDVDRDGRPELVWAIDQDWMVYKSPGNNQFQRVFSAYGDNGHNSTNIHIHDMNGNGYPEIIESGEDETHIWEVETCRLVYPNGGETLYGDSLAVIRWRNVDPFQADSFSLFYSSDSGLTYSPVAHGLPGSDSAYSWTVPKIFSDDCFVLLWAYQNATGWDFSDGPFRIRDGSGVEVTTPYPLHPTPLPLSVTPNPFVSYAKAPCYEQKSFALYDVSGRRVGVYRGDKIGWDVSPGVYFLRAEKGDPRPVRIVKVR